MALKGTQKTLIEHLPQLAISIYHSPLDLFRIPLFIDRILSNYRYHIGHYTDGSRETVWYGIPNELNDND